MIRSIARANVDGFLYLDDGGLERTDGQLAPTRYRHVAGKASRSPAGQTGPERPRAATARPARGQNNNNFSMMMITTTHLGSSDQQDPESQHRCLPRSTTSVGVDIRRQLLRMKSDHHDDLRPGIHCNLVIGSLIHDCTMHDESHMTLARSCHGQPRVVRPGGR